MEQPQQSSPNKFTKPETNALPGLAFSISSEEWTNRNFLRRRSTVRTLALVISLCATLSTAITVSTNGIAGSTYTLTATILFWISYGLAQFSSRKILIDVASYLLLLSMLGVLVLIIFNGTGDPYSIYAAFMLIPVLAVVLEIGQFGTWFGITSGGVILLATTTWREVERVNKLTASGATLSAKEGFQINAFSSWIFIYILVAAGVLVFANRQRRSTLVVEQQAAQLGDLLQTLQTTNNLGSSLSQEMSGITAELGSTSRQHATSSQEQVAGLSQVTASLEELGETAGQIASSALAASGLADKAVTIGNSISTNSQVSQATAEEGNQAVEDTIRSVERVRDRIELLGQRLLTLTEQNRRVGSIIDLIDEIADETHLLALNASIEAAGTILTGTAAKNGSGGTSNVRGERFGVIAQEVKSLSDRSRESTEEVRQAIGEMQGAVAAAVLVAEEGKKETAEAVTRSRIAGAVIQKLMQVISESASRVEQILHAADAVKNLCSEISMATNQQRSANQQILQTMRTIADLAQENSQIISQLSETVLLVNNQMEELNSVLVKSTKTSS